MPREGRRVGPGYVLGVLVAVYVLNFLDRQIVSILAERLKADLRVTDAHLGFLYGTVFAVFFAIFGIPLGRVADVWDRRRLIAWGLAFWSLMTVLSGLAQSFGHLALARIGVGIGEASAVPAAYSLLSDLFPKERRATALAIFSSGIYIGSGLGLLVGGFVVNRWDAAFAATAAPFGLRGWQVAFLAVGLPGLFLALHVRTLPEPARPGGATPGRGPVTEFFHELSALLPGFSFAALRSAGATASVLGSNLGALAGLAATAWLLARTVGNAVQWIALGAGLYAVFSWAQALRLRDAARFEGIFRNRPLVLAMTGFGFLAFSSYSVGFWIAPFFVRVHHLDLARVGAIIGVSAALGGWIGVTLGGLLGDRLHRVRPTGRLEVGLLNAVLPVPLGLLLLFLPDPNGALALGPVVIVASSLWLGPGGSTVSDLVPPGMRATATATYLLFTTFLGLAMGPYVVGRLSVALGDLRLALALGLGGDVVAAVFLALAVRELRRRNREAGAS